jgi:hypothetical protein
LEGRLRRLEKFEAWRSPRRFDVEKEVGSALWEEHWRNLERLVSLMRECEETARRMRELLRARLPA